MSSTNRSQARRKHISDYYVTPVEDILTFLHAFSEHEDIFNRDISILDPCAGGCDENPMSYPTALERFVRDIYGDYGVKHSIVTLDIREDSRAEIIGDYLEVNMEGLFDVIITNPPFNIARSIIEKALNDVREGGWVIMLLRLNYFGSRARKDLWDLQMPKYTFVHHKRMSFTNDGKTDSIEYCHMVWKKGYYPEFTKLKVI